MTAISAAFSDKGIAVATDSMLLAIAPNRDHVYLEWEQPKIIPVPKLKACISYWGFAGALTKIPNGNEKPKWKWQTYQWLKLKASNPKFSTLEEFSQDIAIDLQKELDKISVKNPLDKGIGVHITGLESIEGYLIPELFLVCNFADTSYSALKPLSCSRETYHTVANVPPLDLHREKQYRFAVKDHLKTNMIFYNNGDPELFNNALYAIFYGLSAAARQGVLKPLNTITEIVPMIKRPIEIVADLQRDFFRTTKRRIGGRIHDYSIDNKGLAYSTSGDI